MRWLVFLIAAGCAHQVPVVSFVTGARVDGTSLLVTHCEVTAHDDELRVANCLTEAQALPVIELHPELPRQLDKAQVEAAIAAGKAGLAHCVADLAIAKPTQLHVVVVNGVAKVDADVAILATCATAAFATVAFPPTAEPTSFSFDVGP